jgi:hypothetical protein
MHFNKKKNSGKKIRKRSVERSDWPTGANTVARNASKFAIFFLVRLGVRAFPFRVVIWAIGATTLIFCLQKTVAHLATSPS